MAMTKQMISVLALGLAFVSSDAAAQMTCGPRDQLLKHLAQQFQESPTAIGLSGDGKAVELLTSTTGSWSLVVTAPRGMSCLVGSGEAWQAVPRTVATYEG
jgi:hypothetical protein